MKMELDSVTPNEQAWLGGGCLLMAVGGMMGLVILGAGAEASPLRWFLLGAIGMFALGLCAMAIAFGLQESYLLEPAGVRLRRRWGGFERKRWLARAEQIHCLALDGAERGPRNWRLMLVCRDGKTHELAGYSLLENEEQRWPAAVTQAQQVAAALNVSLLLPEGIERERRLQVRPDAVLEYVELMDLTRAEINSILRMAISLPLILLTILGLAFWLRHQGSI